MRFCNFEIVIEKEAEDEGYSAYSPSLPGCFSNGRTVEEAQHTRGDPAARRGLLAMASPCPRTVRPVASPASFATGAALPLARGWPHQSIPTKSAFSAIIPPTTKCTTSHRRGRRHTYVPYRRHFGGEMGHFRGEMGRFCGRDQRLSRRCPKRALRNSHLRKAHGVHGSVSWQHGSVSWVCPRRPRGNSPRRSETRRKIRKWPEIP